MSTTPRTIAHTPPPSIRRRTTRLTALAAGCVLSLGLIAAPSALAADSATPPVHGPFDGTAPLIPTKPAPPRTPLQQAMLDALAKAKSTGKPVVVDAMTDVASKTVANPNGTLSTTDNALPVRVKQAGGWADIDSTLRQNPDGSISPAVAGTALMFSGGGSGPMATLATADGKTLSVGAPFALPKPALNGDTATYANVLPGVDLQVTALPVGGWRDVIVVRTAEAAANPALKTLRFPLTAQGLTVASDDKGSIDVKDDKGGLRFRSPAPLQWDSAKPAPSASAVASRSYARTALTAAPAAESAPVPAGTVPSTAEAPGDGANIAAISTRVTGDAIELTPDQKALGSGTGPWYLDPTLTAVTSYTQSSVEVQENYKSAKNWNTKSNLATGFCGYHSSDPSLDCGNTGRQRAYFQFGVNPAIYTQVGGAEVPPTLYTSTLNAQVTGASSPSTTTNLGVYWAPTGINGDTNWYQQPCNDNGNQVMGGCSYVGGQPITGSGPMAVDVTDIMKQAANGKWATWTIGIAPSDTEWTKEYRHTIASNPSVTTTYDITPTVWSPHTIPAPGFASNNSKAECTTGGAHPWDNPGWVGSNQNINLTASSYSPSGQNLYTGFHLWDDNDPNFSLGSNNGGWLGSYNNPGYTLPVGSLSDGHQYGWYAQSADGLLTSPQSAWCYFRVDKTNPRVSISSTDFPPSGTPNPTPAKYMNDWGTFTINADDPSPGAGLQASGVACVRVSTDSTVVVGWKCGDNGTLPAGQAYSYQPHQWGTNTLYAQAMDNAGNYSQPAIYNFYVPWKPGTQPLFGDIDNDQKADIVLSDKNGDLRIIGGTSDPASSTAAPAAAAPGNNNYGATWADYQISHRGAFTVGQPVDQLVAHYTKDNAPALKSVLYILTNDGGGHFDTLTPITPARPACMIYGTTNTACDGYNSQDWSDVSQVIAFGTPKGEAVGPKVGDPTKTVFTKQTSVMTLENNKLYIFNPSGNAFGSATLIPTASGSWSDLELINPGAANGITTNPKAPAATAATNQPTLWARNRITGDVYAYPLGWNTDGSVDYSALTAPDKGIKLTTTPVPAATYPRIGAATLYNGDNVSLWAVDTKNAITIYPGLNPSGVAGKVDKLDGPQNAGYTDASFSVHPNSVGSQCMDASGGPRDGAELAIYNCWNTVNQRFNFATDGTIRAGSYCLSTKDNALANGTRVILTTCNGTDGQKWTMRPDGRIYLPATVDAANPGGRCLELPGWATDQGTRLGIWNCPGLQANQQWTIARERTP
ncbi:ricin-type beta-trefoil lectin domain protein [Kitasatospora sp. NPDC059722]|uniref:ricin-type beta-trefoil lectin domain protein n=1 Tax=Kitasatospora sp. NPDC059722 TaxID=3346925 RepID=UPI0036862BB6